ncbi:hypothetical protein [Stygiolobus caldivivus]|uniref:Zinc-ribbon domain-containing protein n=1 Tax=Stygiolobus caldivivus TaxID=2824673 RepID=A0A8D5ZJ08_9CREN|nr:hypothetical protein [Stygiolobus caldivivus]BCU69737.1 hypothetical protein KN1_10340 [Stygiolobus caldivivus]
MKKCPRCGFDNIDTVTSCVRCGYPLTYQGPTAQPTPYQPMYQPTPQPPYQGPPYQQPPPPPPKGKNKLLIPIVGAVGVIAVVLVVIVLFSVLHSGPSGMSFVTPSEASSVLGGTWSINNYTSYTFTVHDGIATVKYLNGMTANRSVASITQGAPTVGITSGYYEYMVGTVNGKSEEITISGIAFQSSSDAVNFFSQVKSVLQMSAAKFKTVSSNEFVAYCYSGSDIESIIVALNGNTLYGIEVIAPQPLGTSQLQSLVSYV